MLNFDFLEKGLWLVSPPHLIHDFPREIFPMLYSSNLLNFIAWLPLILEILDNICIVIICFPVFDIINCDINLSFLINSFSYMTKKVRTKL